MPRGRDGKPRENWPRRDGGNETHSKEGSRYLRKGSRFRGLVDPLCGFERAHPARYHSHKTTGAREWFEQALSDAGIVNFRCTTYVTRSQAHS
jgi:hypothetical protein